MQEALYVMTKAVEHLLRQILIFPVLESRDEDFVVKFKGEIFSWKNFSHLLRQHNITVPQERDVLAEVLRQKDSSSQSCQGRCFLDERSDEKSCYCDQACQTFSDCCLDFHSRYNSAQFDSLVGWAFILKRDLQS